MGQTRPIFCLFLSFSQYKFNYTNWKKFKWGARDLNPQPQDCRHRRYHSAMAATLFWMFLVTTFLIKVAQIFCDVWGYFEKCNFLSKNCCDYFLGNSWIIWATFCSNICSHCVELYSIKRLVLLSSICGMLPCLFYVNFLIFYKHNNLPPWPIRAFMFFY